MTQVWCTLKLDSYSTQVFSLLSSELQRFFTHDSTPPLSVKCSCRAFSDDQSTCVMSVKHSWSWICCNSWNGIALGIVFDIDLLDRRSCHQELTCVCMRESDEKMSCILSMNQALLRTIINASFELCVECQHVNTVVINFCIDWPCCAWSKNRSPLTAPTGKVECNWQKLCFQV